MDLCKTCRKLLYRTDPCKGDGVTCGRTDGGSTKSTAALKEVPPVGELQTDRNRPAQAAGNERPPTRDTKAKAGTQAPPVDTLAKAEAAAAHLAPKHKGGRPKLHADRKIYKAEHERKRRIDGKVKPRAKK